jgi:hypothetical protein
MIRISAICLLLALLAIALRSVTATAPASITRTLAVVFLGMFVTFFIAGVSTPRRPR